VNISLYCDPHSIQSHSASFLQRPSSPCSSFIRLELFLDHLSFLSPALLLSPFPSPTTHHLTYRFSLCILSLRFLTAFPFLWRSIRFFSTRGHTYPFAFECRPQMASMPRITSHTSVSTTSLLSNALSACRCCAIPYSWSAATCTAVVA
jgi:hypothetical protein